MSACEYSESRITVPAEQAKDLYAIHQYVLSITGGDKQISYAPASLHQGNVVVAIRSHASHLENFRRSLRADPESMSLEETATFRVRAAVRLVKRSDFGERMPTQSQALEKWDRLLLDGGFLAEDTNMTDSVMSFFHRRLGHITRLPFWLVSSHLTVVDAEKAAATMVRGVGRSRGLGFGMLMRVDA